MSQLVTSHGANCLRLGLPGALRFSRRVELLFEEGPLVPTCRVLCRPETDLLPELVDADRVDVEGELWVVFRRMVTVIGQPREVVVRRLPAAPIADVVEVA